MTDSTAVPPPPPPPPPDLPQVQTPPAQPAQPPAEQPTQTPQTPQPTQTPSEAQPSAEQPATPQPGTDAGNAAAQTMQEPFDGHPDDAPGTENQPPVDDTDKTTDDDAPDLPQMPAIESIPGTVRVVMLAGGTPEAVFARDLKIPVTEREDLIRKVGKALTGMDIPRGDDLTNVAANCTTVKELIEFFELSHPDHPTQTGAGS